MRLLKQRICCVIVLAFVGSVGFAEPASKRLERFNPSGEYHPQTRPSEDILFLQFHLKTRYKRGKLVAWGDLYGHENRFYKFKVVSVTEKHLRFSTRRLHSIGYTFEGEFLRSGNFTTSLDIPGSLPLRGTLRKYVNGRKVMELNTSFVYYVGC